jgi:N-acetylglutamate synthase-like GNAT family acetyltransferase
MFTIRKAVQKDSRAIRALIWKVQINPTGLNWRHFLVTVDEQDRVIATGQIKPHRDGTRELASIATHPDFRGQGLASAIIARLLTENPPPLYLKCAEHMGPFYLRFGFRSLDPPEMPADYARDVRFMDRLRRSVAPNIERLLVMKLD